METEIIFIPSESNYKVGAITYKVTAFFDAEKSSLKEKIKCLLADDIGNHTNRTIADILGNGVK